MVLGPASRELGAKITSKLGIKPLDMVFKQFPDGESYFRFPELKDDEVVVIQGTHPPQEKHLLQLFLMCRGLRDLGVERIRAVVPYLAYARQDRAFMEGEVVSLSIIIDLMKASSIDELITINPHSPWALEKAAIRVKSLDAVGVLAEYVASKGLREPIVISPGKKGLEMARSAAALLEAEYAAAISSRDPISGEVKVELGDVAVKGRDVLVLDDLVSTGGTMSLVVSEAVKRKARRVIASCIHGLFINSADEKIFSAGAKEIIATDSTPSKYSVVSVAGLIASYLAKTAT